MEVQQMNPFGSPTADLSPELRRLTVQIVVMSGALLNGFVGVVALDRLAMVMCMVLFLASFTLNYVDFPGRLG
jgi:hypothetical protein